MYDEVISIIINTIELNNKFLISVDDFAKTIKVLYARNTKAIELLNKRKEDVKDLPWVEMRRESYYEECDEIINVLEGDDENEK